MVGSDRAPVSCSSAALPALTILRTVSWCSPVVSQMERCDWGCRRYLRVTKQMPAVSVKSEHSSKSCVDRLQFDRA